MLGVAAGIANFDIRYDHNGLSIHTGWSRSASNVVAPDTHSRAATDDRAAWRAELTAVEQQLRSEMHTSQASSPAGGLQVAHVSSSDADVMRRVKLLLDESERRQQNELALRMGEVIRDLSVQRQADLRKIDQNLGVLQDRTGVEVLLQSSEARLHLAARITAAAVGGFVTRNVFSAMVIGCLAAPALAQPEQSAPLAREEQVARQQRYEIGLLERVLESAVEHGVTVTRDRLQALAQMPTELLLSDNAHARGFRLDEAWVFFDVSVPSFEATLWTIRSALDQNDLGLDSAMRQLQEIVKVGNTNAEQALRRVELQVGPTQRPAAAAPVPATSGH